MTIKSLHHLLLGNIIGFLLSMVTLIIITNILGAREYGIVAASQAFGISIFNFGANWASPYIIRFGTKQIYQQGKLGDVFWKSVQITILTSGIVLLIARQLVVFKIVDLHINYNLIALLLIGFFLLNTLRIGLQTVQNFKIYSLFIWLDRMSTLILVLILAFIFKNPTSSKTLYIGAVSMIITATIGLFLFFDKNRSQKKFFSLSDFLSVSLPILLSSGIEYFASWPFIILVATAYFGLIQTGWVSVAFTMAGAMTSPIIWVSPILLPKFTLALETKNDYKLKNYLEKDVLLILTLYSLCVVILIILLPLVIRLIGKDFYPAIPIISLILSAFGAEALHTLINPLLIARHQQKRYLIISTLKISVLFLTIFFSHRNIDNFTIGLWLSYWFGSFIEVWSLKDLVNSIFFGKIGLICLLSSLPGLWLLRGSHDNFLTISITCLIVLIILTYKNKRIFMERILPILKTKTDDIKNGKISTKDTTQN